MPLPNSEKEDSVKIALRELRSMYNHINRNWHGLKSRTLGLLVGEVAIATFIFSGNNEKLLPDPTYGKVFFFTGLVLISIAFGLLLWILSTASWQIPFDTTTSRKLYKIFNTKLEILEHIKEDYESCIDHCLKKIATRAQVYNKALIILAVGIIILLVLKFS